MSLALAQRLGVSPEEVAEARRLRLVRRHGGRAQPARDLVHPQRFRAQAGGKRLAFGIAVTRDFAPEEVGTLAEVREVAAAVKTRASARPASPTAKDVHYVQVKGPLLTPAAVADADRAAPNSSRAIPTARRPSPAARPRSALRSALGEVERSRR